MNNIEEVKPRKWLLIILIVIGIAIVVVLADKVVQDKKNNIGLFKEQQTSFAVRSFNNTFENRTGTKWGSSVRYLIDDVITNNKTNKNHVITLVFDNNTTTDPEEMKNLKKNLKDFDDYECSADYDDNGYINKITIESLDPHDLEAQETENVENTDSGKENNTKTNTTTKSGNNTKTDNKTEEKETNDEWFERSTFNQKYEVYTGHTQSGLGIGMLLDNIAANNSGSHIITVSFNGITTSDVSTIKGLKNSADSFKNYSVSVGYDASKYVNSITIKEA